MKSVREPVLLANAHALAAGHAEVSAVVDGQPWVQPTYPYQGKCLAWLRRDHQALDEPARALVESAVLTQNLMDTAALQRDLLRRLLPETVTQNARTVKARYRIL